MRALRVDLFGSAGLYTAPLTIGHHMKLRNRIEKAENYICSPVAPAGSVLWVGHARPKSRTSRGTMAGGRRLSILCLSSTCVGREISRNTCPSRTLTYIATIFAVSILSISIRQNRGGWKSKPVDFLVQDFVGSIFKLLARDSFKASCFGILELTAGDQVGILHSRRCM